MTTERTQYVEKTESENISGYAWNKIIHLGLGMLVGGTAAAIGGLCAAGIAGSSRPRGYVEYKGGTNEVYGALSPEMQWLEDAGFATSLCGLAAAASGTGVAAYAEKKIEQKAAKLKG